MRQIDHVNTFNWVKKNLDN